MAFENSNELSKNRQVISNRCYVRFDRIKKKKKKKKKKKMLKTLILT